MKEIEIRANALYPILHENHQENRIKNAQFQAYVKGATEQKKIDIEKAIKAHCHLCGLCGINGAFECDDQEVCYDVAYIRKSMRDEDTEKDNTD